jgi:hypothetical protein
MTAAGNSREDQSDACIVATHSVGGLSKGQQIEVHRRGLSIGTASCDVAVACEPASDSRIQLSWSGAPGLWLAVASGRAWLNGERLASGTVRSGDDIRVEDSYFRFVCGEDVREKFHETIYQLTITDFPTGLGNARAFGEAFQQRMRRARSHVVVAMIGVQSSSKAATSSHDLLAGVAERVRKNRPRSWYAARVGELEIALVVTDESAKSVEEAIDRWLIGCEAEGGRPWLGVTEVDSASPVEAALTSARNRRRNQSG